MNNIENDIGMFMRVALEEAKLAALYDEVPVGAVLVRNNEIIARDHNRTIENNDPTSHAELNVIRKGAQRLNNYRLNDCDIYTTVEPCMMCAGALINARVRSVYFGCYDEKGGAAGSRVNLFEKGLFNHNVNVYQGLLKQESAMLLKNFFQSKRNLKTV